MWHFTPSIGDVSVRNYLLFERKRMIKIGTGRGLSAIA